ncbi:hypothetical protein [Nitrospina watsonii]|uniref:Uncharacterized protein n=1 Tax=Nitrospina watsonii TaxID=1323948 RepID=A0ABM9HB11_9BACT|nr:hypothetical protein [Nitrospina watsonii]CAI2717297.1 conserved protein of unknown function [Nitrospina watsonii]
MLAFALDITKTQPSHPDEANNPKLKEYMDYQRALNHEKLIFHTLDHAKTGLQTAIQDSWGEKNKTDDYVKKHFPVSHRYADQETLMVMLRKLVNAHNTTNNWYRLNPFYCGLIYDALEDFLRMYNRLAREEPEKAEELGVAEGGLEVDFDDWVRMHFLDLDFMIGQKLDYVHFASRRRNRAIEAFIQKQIDAGKSKLDAAKEAGDAFNMDEASIRIYLGYQINHQDLELFYTSAENPIYEYLYDPNAEEGFMDGETLIDHSYFLGHQLMGLSESETEKVIEEIEKLSKH